LIGLRLMTPADVYNRRAWMREGVERTAQKTGARLAFEDVWLRLRTGSAFAHAIEDDGKPIGCAVLYSEQDPDGPALFVWVLWTDRGARALERAHESYAELERIARAIGAVRIRMQSPRKGWEREAFFKPIATVFEHDIRG